MGFLPQNAVFLRVSHSCIHLHRRKWKATCINQAHMTNVRDWVESPLSTTNAPGYQMHVNMTAIQSGSPTSLFSIVKERNTGLEQSCIRWDSCRDSGSGVWLKWPEVRLQVETVRASLREQLLFSSPQSHQLCPFSERRRKSVFYVKFLNI